MQQMRQNTPFCFDGGVDRDAGNDMSLFAVFDEEDTPWVDSEPTDATDHTATSDGSTLDGRTLLPHALDLDLTDAQTRGSESSHAAEQGSLTAQPYGSGVQLVPDIVSLDFHFSKYSSDGRLSPAGTRSQAYGSISDASPCSSAVEDCYNCGNFAESGDCGISAELPRGAGVAASDPWQFTLPQPELVSEACVLETPGSPIDDLELDAPDWNMFASSLIRSGGRERGDGCFMGVCSGEDRASEIASGGHENPLFEQVFDEIVVSATSEDQFQQMVDNTIALMRSRNASGSCSLVLDWGEITPLFSLSRQQIVERAGIHMHVFKRTIKKAGINRWPFRKYQQTQKKVMQLTTRFRRKIAAGVLRPRARKNRESFAAWYNAELNRIRAAAATMLDDM